MSKGQRNLEGARMRRTEMPRFARRPGPLNGPATLGPLGARRIRRSLPWPVVFTADGSHVIWVVEGLSVSSKNVSLVVADGLEGKRFDYVYGMPRITFEGGSIEYVAQTGRRFCLVRQPLETRSPTP